MDTLVPQSMGMDGVDVRGSSCGDTVAQANVDLVGGVLTALIGASSGDGAILIFTGAYTGG